MSRGEMPKYDGRCLTCRDEKKRATGLLAFDAESRRKILYGNAAKLYGLD
jgi:hypothetical protein